MEWLIAIGAIAALLTPLAVRLFRSTEESRKADRYKAEKRARKTVININEHRNKRRNK